MRRGLRATPLCEAEGRRGPEGRAAEDQLLCGQGEVSAALGRLLSTQRLSVEASSGRLWFSGQRHRKQIGLFMARIVWPR